MAAPVGSPMPSSFVAPAPVSNATQSILEADDASSRLRDDFELNSSSITASIRDYEFENGRRYHAYKAGAYSFPNDEKELDRLDLQHHICTLLCNGNLHLAPLVNPSRVLDIGTGTGIWAIEFAEQYPKSTVIGTDLSPVQPAWCGIAITNASHYAPLWLKFFRVPDNVHFEIDDVEGKWGYSEKSFDYIHSRFMIGSISNWQSYARKAFKHLKPGGYFEMQELQPRCLSDDGSLKEDSMQVKWARLMMEASQRYNRPVPEYRAYKEWMEEAGFVDIQEYFLKRPVNTWPKNKQLKEIGRAQLMNYLEGIEGLTIGLFTRALGWTAAEVQVLIAKLRPELKDRTIHSYQIFAVLVGRKPESSPTPNTTTVPNSTKTPNATT